jgi:hypothetical protein
LADLAFAVGSRSVVRSKCLPQALAVYYLLRHRGGNPHLSLGVRRQDERFDAHAWVELDGQPLGQRDLAHVELRPTTPIGS